MRSLYGSFDLLSPFDSLLVESLFDASCMEGSEAAIRAVLYSLSF